MLSRVANSLYWMSRYIERAENIARILDVRYHTLPARGLPPSVNQTEALEWSAILRSCSAWDAFKSLYGVEVHPRDVAELLLFNPDFPRSVRFCVDELNGALRRISGVSEGRFSNDAEKLAGRLAAELQYGTVEAVFDLGLHDYLDKLQFRLNAIGEAVFNTYIFLAFDTGNEPWPPLQAAATWDRPSPVGRGWASNPKALSRLRSCTTGGRTPGKRP
jgi:uncharacterized alpha-E superfamily protein